MVNRFAALAVSSLIPLIAGSAAPIALADPPADDPGPPPDNGVVASADPGVVTTPDGWVLTVAGANETQLPVAPLTTAVSSREYLVGGTFTGTIGGHGKTSLNGGTLEAGYQIGCGIELGQVRLIGQVGVSTSGSAIPGANLLPADRQLADAFVHFLEHRPEQEIRERVRAEIPHQPHYSLMVAGGAWGAALMFLFLLLVLDNPRPATFLLATIIILAVVAALAHGFLFMARYGWKAPRIVVAPPRGRPHDRG